MTRKQFAKKYLKVEMEKNEFIFKGQFDKSLVLAAQLDEIEKAALASGLFDSFMDFHLEIDIAAGL